MSAEIIIKRFGGIRKMARKLGHRNHTTVQGWADSGVIPAQRQREILDAAKALGVRVAAHELIPRAQTEPTEAA